MAHTFKSYVKHLFRWVTFEKYYTGSVFPLKKCWVLRIKFKRFLIEIKLD